MTRAVPLRAASVAALASASLVGLLAFFWPFVAAPESAAVAHAKDAPFWFALLLPVLLAVAFSQLHVPGSGAKAIAMLGVLSALVAVLRPLGTGHAGLEPFWCIIIIGGRALGPGFGFCLGSVGIFASALLTGGFGPWLPFQMIGAAWVGMGAGLLPQRLTGRVEVVVLACYGFLSTIAFGFLLNAWFWPYLTGADTGLSFQPGDPVTENLGRLLAFCLATSLGYDLPRAIVTVVLILIVGRPLLRSLRRAARRANFTPSVQFETVGAER